MAVVPRPVGRPGRYAKYDRFESSLPPKMAKRALYCDGIGLFRGERAFTVWVKIRMPRGGLYKGRTVRSGGAVEIKIGNRSSYSWAQLEEERDRLQGLADRGAPLEDIQVGTFAVYADEWLERKKATVKGYGVLKGHIQKHLKPAFGLKAVDVITVGDVNRWISRQRAAAKPGTVQRQLSTFNAIMNDAVRNGIIERNPSSMADKIRGVEGRQRIVVGQEWETILATADKIEAEQETKKEVTPQQKRGWLRNFVMWAYHSGMRRAEILNLSLGNIRQIDEGHTVVEVLTSKNGKPRYVTCTTEMKSIIERLRELERQGDDDRLFPVSMTTAKRALTKLWKETGLKDIRLHDLRRSHATYLVSKGVDVRTVAGRLGHSGTAMLAKHYAIDQGDKEAAALF